jgi:hypothetical protein
MVIITGTTFVSMAQSSKVKTYCSAKVDGSYYKALYYSDNSIALVRQSDGKKLIWKEDDAVSSLQFVDFNRDGYKDLLVDYFTNVPDIWSLILFDVRSKSFIKVDKFENFPAAIRISHTNLYYSYHRSGCADMTWDSDLFIIDHFKAVAIGNINGTACNNQDKEDGIYISKVRGDKLELYKKLPISTLSEFDDKWGFIKQYWQRHYHEFLRTK